MSRARAALAEPTRCGELLSREHRAGAARTAFTLLAAALSAAETVRAAEPADTARTCRHRPNDPALELIGARRG
jgi:hypothetical protein